MFVQMLMMHFMCPADSPYIGIIAAGKPFEPLMNDNIMHHKIGKPIRHNTKPNGLHPPNMIKGTKINQQILGTAKMIKKASFFSKKPGLYLVMIFMQIP